MSYAKHGVSVIRPCVNILVTTEDIRDLQDMNTRELRQTSSARVELAFYIVYNEILGKTDVYGEKHDLYRTAGDKFSVLSLTK